MNIIRNLFNRVKKNNFLNQTIFYALGILLMKAVSLLMIPVITGYLSTDDYGRLEFLASIANFVSLIVGFGLVESLYRYVGLTTSVEQKRDLAANAFGMVLIMGAGILILGQCLAPLIMPFIPEGIALIDVRLVFMAICLEGSIGMPLAWLRMQDKARVFFVLTSLKALFQALLIFVLLRAGYSVHGVILAGFIAALGLMLLLVFYQYRDTGIKFNLTQGWPLLRYGSPVAISGLAAFALMGADIWMLGISQGVAVLGVYALAVKFAIAIGIVMQPFNLWWMSRRFNCLNDSQGIKTSARITLIGVTLTLGCAVAMAYFAPILIRALTPPSYHMAVTYIPWMAMIMAIKGAGDLMNMGCFIGESTRSYMYISLCTASTALAGFMLLIPTWGPMGAIWSLLLAHSLRFCMTLAYSQRKLTLPYAYSRLIGFSVCAFLAIYLSSQLSSWISELSLGILVLFGLILLGMKINLVPRRITL